MPKKKKSVVSSSSTVSVSNARRYTQVDTQQQILALCWWDSSTKDYILYGITEAPPNYRKFVHNILGFYQSDEEIQIRMSCGEVLCITIALENNKFERCEVVLKHLPEDLMKKYKAHLEAAILQDKKSALIMQEQERNQD